MVDITRIHIHFVTPQNARGISKRVVKKIKPSQPHDKLAIQQDIGEVVRKMRDTGKYEYWYVILEINRGNKPAFRSYKKVMF